MQLSTLKSPSMGNTNYTDSLSFALGKKLHNGSGVVRPPGFENAVVSRNRQLQAESVSYEEDERLVLKLKDGGRLVMAVCEPARGRTVEEVCFNFFELFKILQAERSDRLFKQNDGIDEDLIDRVAAREKFVDEIEAREMNQVVHMGETHYFPNSRSLEE